MSVKRHGVLVLACCLVLAVAMTSGCGNCADSFNVDAGVGGEGYEKPESCWVCSSAHEGAYSITYEYDEHGNLTRYVSLEGDNKLDSCEFQYDAYGNRTMATSHYGDTPSGSWTYQNEVDDGGRLTQRHWEITGEGLWREEATGEGFTYWPDGAVKQTVSHISYKYDTSGDAGGGTDMLYTMREDRTIAYNDEGLPSEIEIVSYLTSDPDAGDEASLGRSTVFATYEWGVSDEGHVVSLTRTTRMYDSDETGGIAKEYAPQTVTFSIKTDEHGNVTHLSGAGIERWWEYAEVPNPTVGAYANASTRDALYAAIHP